MLQKSRLGDGSVPEPLQRALKLKLAERLIDERLIEDAASELGLFAQESDIDIALARFKADFHSESGFERFVAEYPLGLEEIRQRLRIRWLRNRLIEAESQPLSEQAVKAYYDSDPARFDGPEHCMAREILVRSDTRDTTAARHTKRERAEKLHKEAQSSGKPFEQLARQHSEGPTAATGGDLGRMTAQTSEPRLWEALIRLKPGGISEVVETRDGFHILYLVAKKSAVRRSFAEMEPQVRTEFNELMQRRRNEALLPRLRARAQVSNLLAERLGSPPVAEPDSKSAPADERKQLDAFVDKAPSSTAAEAPTPGSQPFDL
ncbi:hypothetical protein Q664_01430 [Archangium violaceum Cb vi76]|uniref:PpiC domain-containing protein n=2 Tax=Archangium violaceum TaxID=83451 RepID=A0A084T1L1_9BACT|nr:hypothetical protein Q664_01430 [Archangium violaceum Cb vi76]